LLVQRITERYTPDEARIMVLDYRRTLLDVVPPDYLVGYGNQPERRRRAHERGRPRPWSHGCPARVTAEQLRNRSWWDGMELYVIVDDYDLVASAMAESGAGAASLHSAGRATSGWHVILARRSGGAVGRCTTGADRAA